MAPFSVTEIPIKYNGKFHPEKGNYAMIESNVKEDNIEILTKFHNVAKRKKRFKLINNNPFEKTYAEGTQIAINLILKAIFDQNVEFPT